MDKDWVTGLYTKYSDKILRYLYSHTNSMHDAEDIMQDVFASIHKHAGNFDPSRCSEEAWIYIIAKRRLISYYRAKKPVVSIDDAYDSVMSKVSPEHDAAILMEHREAVAEALKLLDERSRQIVIMKYFLDMDDGEISDRLGLSEVNVRVIRSRAMKKMRNGSIQADKKERKLK